MSVGGGGTFQTPDIINNVSFETGEANSGWGPFTDWADGIPPTGVTRDNVLATPYGSWSVKRSIDPSAGEVGSQCICPTGAHDRTFIRFYFRLTCPVSTIMKWCRFYDPGFAQNLGGLFLQNGANLIKWSYDTEDSGTATTIGLSEAQVIDGSWHSIEFDYWKNGDPSGFASVAFWFDGNEQYLADGTTPEGTPPNPWFWSNKRLNCGERIIPLATKLGVIEWLATLNAGNTTTGQCNIDRVAASTQRIGP